MAAASLRYSGEQLVRRDLMEILEDPLLNPAGKKLTMLEAVRGRAELTRARSLMEILESEVRVEYDRGMEEIAEPSTRRLRAVLGD